MPHVRSRRRLDSRTSGLFVVDLQVKLLPAIPASETVVRQVHRLLDAAELFGVPVAATVQYPQGLGGLESTLASRIAAVESKTAFTAAVCRSSLDAWLGDGRNQIVVVGIETSICVVQTVLDLLAEGLDVFVVAEAVAARKERDHQLALERMRDHGATVMPVESVLFEWCHDASRAEFKALSAIVKSETKS